MSIEVTMPELFDGFPEPVLLIQDGLIQYFNPAAQQLFLKCSIRDQVPQDLEELLPQARPAVLTGHLRNCQVRIHVSTTSMGDLVTLHTQVEQRDVPLGNLATALRQQTASLSAVIQRMNYPEEAKSRKYHALANQGMYRLLRLVDQIEFAGWTDEMLYHPEVLDLAGLCSALSRQIEGVARSAGYMFQYESNLTSLLTVGDDVLLNRLLLSLLSNAMKASGPERKFGLRLIKRDSRAVLTVWDEGPSLGEGGLALLFRDGTELPLGGGLGLGLSSVRRITALHGGTFLAEAGESTGLRVVVSLPLRETIESELPLRSPSPVVDSLGGFSALMVELSEALPPESYFPEEIE